MLPSVAALLCNVCDLVVCSADRAMQDVFGAKYVSLHVRVTNKGAHHLYTQSLGYKCAFLPTNTTHTK